MTTTFIICNSPLRDSTAFAFAGRWITSADINRALAHGTEWPPIELTVSREPLLLYDTASDAGTRVTGRIRLIVIGLFMDNDRGAAHRKQGVRPVAQGNP